MSTVTLHYRALVVSRPRKRGNPTVVSALVAALALFGAVAAGVAQHRNAARAARFRGDAGCVAPLTAPLSPSISACRVDVAQVANRWISWRSKSRVLNVALRAASDGFVDSVELKGLDARRLWDSAPVGASVLVQRFTDSNRSHITVVQSSRLVSRTEWNPVWRENDAMVGMVFSSAIGLVALVALVVSRARARRAASSQF
jgi:hypothetical protein